MKSRILAWKETKSKTLDFSQPITAEFYGVKSEGRTFSLTVQEYNEETGLPVRLKLDLKDDKKNKSMFLTGYIGTINERKHDASTIESWLFSSVDFQCIVQLRDSSGFIKLNTSNKSEIEKIYESILVFFQLKANLISKKRSFRWTQFMQPELEKHFKQYIFPNKSPEQLVAFTPEVIDADSQSAPLQQPTKRPKLSQDEDQLLSESKQSSSTKKVIVFLSDSRSVSIVSHNKVEWDFGAVGNFQNEFGKGETLLQKLEREGFFGTPPPTQHIPDPVNIFDIGRKVSLDK